MPVYERRNLALNTRAEKVMLYAASDGEETVRRALLLNHMLRAAQPALIYLLRHDPVRDIRVHAEQLLLEARLSGKHPQSMAVHQHG